jgi:(+)-pinoresinol hydroxylase
MQSFSRLISHVLFSIVCCLAVVLSAKEVQRESPTVASGRVVYATWCVQCHGPGPGREGRGLTGTEALEAKYNGKLPAILDQRKDLTPQYVAFVVRHGASVMPFFRKTEISDAQLADLGAYLTRLNPK